MSEDNTFMYIALGIGAYFLWQHLQAAPAPAAVGSAPVAVVPAVTPVTQTPVNPMGQMTIDTGNSGGRFWGKYPRAITDVPPPQTATVAPGTTISLPPGQQPPPSPNVQWIPVSGGGTFVTWHAAVAPADAGGPMIMANY